MCPGVSPYSIAGLAGQLTKLGTPMNRTDLYNDVMKNPAASRDDKSYAIYRAVHCYQPAHNNGCGGTEVPLAKRKAWYDELKAKYGDTVWAKDLHYYW